MAKKQMDLNQTKEISLACDHILCAYISILKKKHIAG